MTLLVVNSITAQHVYERGTFISIPAGKHINHSYYSTWNAYFAVEDGVLVYDHHNGNWQDAITASNGLSQYPVLLVWQDAGTQDVWMVTPDYVYIYDELNDFMSRQSLPIDPLFTGIYKLGVSDTYIIVSSKSEENDQSYSALFYKNSATFERWGPDSTLDINWKNVDWINTISQGLADIHNSLPVQTVRNGGFHADGRLHLDGYPNKSASQTSSLIGDPLAGEAFLSTYGMGIFKQSISGGDFVNLPYGLLSPDVMSLEMVDDTLIVGGRAGLSFVKDYEFGYDEAIRDPAFDYSFVSSIENTGNSIIIAGRGGVFLADDKRASWNRIITKKDLVSKRIYSVASGLDGNIMIATERNAYMYHESGLLLQRLFPENVDWPVYHINYQDQRYYISTYFGLYVFDEASLSFTHKVNSSGELIPPNSPNGVDPVYKSTLSGDNLWASTHRGLMSVNLVTEIGKFYLSPDAPFKPRGLSVAGDYVWVGTETGVFSFNANASSWRHYSQNDGLISNFVTDIVARGNYIWIGTNLGLTRIKWKSLY